jgi:ATP-dependent Clp protease ATP-binding subunit ClpC
VTIPPYLLYLGGGLLVGILAAVLYRENFTNKVQSGLLALYSKDLTDLARKGKLDPVIGREHEIQRVIQILARRTKNNPVLIGESGVGKTAIVEELAQEIAKGNVPDILKGKKVLALDLSGLVAGTKYRGEFEKRLKTITDEIIAAERQIILFIDEMHTLAEAGEATGAIDAADILKPALARGDLQAIGATTLPEYKKSIEQDPTLERRFQPVFIHEPDARETVRILEGLKPKYEEHHRVSIDSDAIGEAVELSDRFLNDRYFPDKAIDLLDEAAAKVHLAAIKDGRTPNPATLHVTASDVRDIIQDWTNDLVAIHPKKPISPPDGRQEPR